jgi:predicted lysophospholipase L1 biosynthesis ABC-type transport system permease subunit
MSLETLHQYPVLSIVVGTDGSATAIERARTTLERLYPQRRSPSTDAENQADKTRTLNQWKQLADVVILASLAIAGCSLAVSVIGGLSDRKLPFSMLRLSGVPLGLLRRVITLESAAPLLAASAVAIATGLLAAHLFLQAQMSYTLAPPAIGYYLTVATGLAVCLAIIASTMPLLRRITGPETARNE